MKNKRLVRDAILDLPKFGESYERGRKKPQAQSVARDEQARIQGGVMGGS